MKQRACPHSDPACTSCRNKRNRQRGQATQRRVFDLLDIKPKYRGQKANEEQWPESPHLPGVRWEVKKSKTLPAFIRNAIAQIEASRPGMGSMFSPAVAVEMEGSQEPYAVIALADLVNLGKAWREVGQAHRIKDYFRQIERIAREGAGSL